MPEYVLEMSGKANLAFGYKLFAMAYITSDRYGGLELDNYQTLACWNETY
jgi:hypothetical protein